MLCQKVAQYLIQNNILNVFYFQLPDVTDAVCVLDQSFGGPDFSVIDAGIQILVKSKTMEAASDVAQKVMTLMHNKELFLEDCYIPNCSAVTPILFIGIDELQRYCFSMNFSLPSRF